jgi:hypothetical protein
MVTGVWTINKLYSSWPDMSTRTDEALMRLDACIALYREVGITGYRLELHPDCPGVWILVLTCTQANEAVFKSLRSIWLICSKEWNLGGIQVNNLRPLMADSLNLCCWP